MENVIDVVIKELCQRLGTREARLVNGKPSFLMEEWTQEEEDGFIKWFEEFLLNNSEARYAFMTVPSRSKKAIRKAAAQLVWYTPKVITLNEKQI